MKKLLFVISAFVCQLALSSPSPEGSRLFPDRIQSMRFDKSKVERIYLAPGLGSIVLFPCTLQEVFVGRGEDLKVQISPNDKKTLFLNLKLNSSLPTNVIVKCEPEKSIFVFDVIPSKTRHQDLVEIRSSFGRPNSKDFTTMQTTRSVNRLIVKSPELIEKGGAK